MSKTLVRYFVIFQVALFVVMIFTPFFIPKKDNKYQYQDTTSVISRFLSPRANYDGIKYLTIAKIGYTPEVSAYFPLYPNLIAKISKFTGLTVLFSSLVISTLCMALMLMIAYRLIRLDYPSKVAHQSLLLLLLFPTSFFLGMVYTESLLLLLVLATFYFARSSHWWLAGICGALAAHTRVVGIFLFPALLYEFYEQYQSTHPKTPSSKPQTTNHKLPTQSQNIRRFNPLTRERFNGLVKLIPIFIIPLGLYFYMHFLAINFHDPLRFLHGQPSFSNYQTERIVLFYQVIYRYLRMILTTRLDPLYLAIWLELIVGVGFAILIYFAYTKKVRQSYLVFAVGAFIVPTLTGSFSSLPRFALMMLPVFIYLGGLDNKIIKPLCYVFGILWVVCAALFLRGYWVA